MTIHHTNTGYGPNSEMDMSGRFVPTVDFDAMKDDDKFSFIRLPAEAFRECTCKLGSDPMQNFHSLQPIPNQTGLNPGQLQCLVTDPSVLAVPGPQESGSMGYNRAREALNDHRETAHRAFLQQALISLLSLILMKRTARQNLVNSRELSSRSSQ